jgi:glycosyltransferase involved in cell wall biosynthesis
LHVLEPLPPKQRAYAVRAHRDWRFIPFLGVSPAMRAALREEAASADIMHNHGLWKMPNVYASQAVRRCACRLVMAPRGMLSLWGLRHSRYRKRLMWWLCQGKAVRDAHCFHATAENEYKDIRRAGLRAPVAIVPNGIDIPPESPLPANRDGKRRLLFLGRIHPVKGIDLLLRAWRKVQPDFPDWELCIAGPDQYGYQQEMERLGESLAVQGVKFPGPAYGSDKSQMFRSAELFILPTHTENFGMAVAEALAHAVPAIVTKGAPWAGLETHGCGWWIEQSVEALTACLDSVLRLTTTELRERGQRGRQWMEKEFSWARIGEMMEKTYQWLLGVGPVPSWVMLA